MEKVLKKPLTPGLGLFFQYDFKKFIEKNKKKDTKNNMPKNLHRQMGYPFVTVSQENSILKFEQKRFLTNVDEDLNFPPSNFNYLWNIPLSLCDSKNGEKIYRLK